MKQIKRLTALLTAMLMLAQTIPLIISAEPSDNLKDYEQKSELLEAFELTDGYISFFNPGDSLSRAEFAVVISHIYGMPKSNASPVSYFSDMQGQSSEVVSAVNLLSDLKLISGTGNGIFSPDSHITVSQAVKVLVSLTGYGVYANLKGGYPNGYISQAASLGITAGISGDFEADLKWHDFVTLLYNTLYVDLLQIADYANEAEYKVVGDENLITNVMNISVLHDVKVTGNFAGTLSGGEGVKADCTEIDGKLYYDRDNTAGQYIGRSIDLYYKTVPDGMNTVVYAESDYEGTGLTINFEDIESLSGYSVTYYDENTGKETVTLSSDTMMLFNQQCSLYDPDSVNTLLNGKFILEKSAPSSRYDFVTVEQYTTVIADAIDYDRMIVYDKITQGTPMYLEDYIQNDSCRIYVDGSSAAVTSIPVGSVLSVYLTPDSKFMSIRVSTKKLSGTLEAVSEKNVVIDGISYDLSVQLADEAADRLSTHCEVYFDSEGSVAWFAASRGSDYTYGYLISAAQTNGIDSCVKLRILSEDNAVYDYTVSDKLIFNDSKINVESVSDLGTEIYDGKAVQQLLLYKLNSDGEISTVRTAEPDSELAGRHTDDRFVISYEKSARKYKRGSATFAMKFSASSDTKIFVVSTSGDDNPECFAVQSVSYFSNDFDYVVEAYNINGGGIPEAIVCWDEIQNTVPLENSSEIMVDRITAALDEAGESVWVLHGLMNGAFVKYYAESEEILSASGRKLKRGDIVRISLNRNGRISSVILDVDFDTHKTTDNFFGTFYSAYWARSGVFYSKESGYGLMAFETAPSLSDLFSSGKTDNLYSVRLNGTVMIYDVRADMIYPGNVNDILTYRSAGENASRCFCKFNYESLTHIFVYKY